MRADLTLQKLEVYVVAAVAVILVSSFSFFLSGPFSAQDYGVTDASTAPPQSSAKSFSAGSELPALLEPALRSLDGVTHYG